MAKAASDSYYIDLPEGVSADAVHVLVARAAQAVGLYISHIGSYSRKKYPDSVHWHFKQAPDEPGILDATFWDVKSLLWLMIRHREPAWVHARVPSFLEALRREAAALD